jgi:hypothetical protein
MRYGIVPDYFLPSERSLDTDTQNGVIPTREKQNCAKLDSFQEYMGCVMVSLARASRTIGSQSPTAAGQGLGGLLEDLDETNNLLAMRPMVHH